MYIPPSFETILHNGSTTGNELIDHWALVVAGAPLDDSHIV